MEKIIKEAARGLRKNQTEAEKMLWDRLRYRQLDDCKFRRQRPVGRFVADFICLERKLIIELDGEHHPDSPKGTTSGTIGLKNPVIGSCASGTGK